MAKVIFEKIRKHYLIILLTLFLSIGFWILNYNITLPFSGVLYWDYARHFQAANIDSPYMLPLLIKLYSFVFGTSALAFGYINFLFFTITMVVLYAIIYPLYGKISALLGVVMFCALPVQAKFFEHLDYHLVVIMLFSFLILSLTYWQRIQTNKHLYLSGIFLGMMLMAQFESVILAASLMLASFCVKEFRILWCKPAFYLSLVIAFCFVVPFLIWQVQHQWLTLRYLLNSNGTPLDFSGFISSIWDYLGSVGLFMLLIIAVLIRTRWLKGLESNSQFFFYLWLFIFVLLSFMFMHNPILHTTLISANYALFLFLSATSYRLFPKLTIISTLLSLLVSLVYMTLNMIVSYSNNYLSFTPLIQPMVKAHTLIISNVSPFDNSPSWFSITLKDQPPVFALQDEKINFHNKGNSAVYLWQPPLKQLITEPKWQEVLVLTNTSALPARLQPYLHCQSPIPLTITIDVVYSIQQLLKTGKHKEDLTIYAHPCSIKPQHTYPHPPPRIREGED